MKRNMCPAAFLAMLILIISQELLPQRSQPILIGIGTEAKWSPNEKAIAFLRGDSLYVKSLSPDQPARGIYYAPIVAYEWLDDSTLATYEKGYYPVSGATTRVQRIAKVPLNAPALEIAKDSLNMDSPSPRFSGFRRFTDGSVGYFDNRNADNAPVRLSSSTSPLGKHTDSAQVTLLLRTIPEGWGKVCICYGNSGDCRLVTKSENHYLLPLLCPTYDRFVCHSMRGDLVMFDTLGNELANLGRGHFESWSPIGDLIAFCYTKESEFDIVKSDIYIANYDGTERKQITDTPDVVEIDPTFSPSGMKLLYRENPSDKLFVITVK